MKGGVALVTALGPGPRGRLALACLLSVSIWGAGCAANGPHGGLEHVVMVWLKEPGNLEARQRVIAASKSLAAIPGVTGVRAGEVVPSGRPMADDTFDVGVVIELESQAALATYLDHPLHVRAVRETLEPLVDRIAIYDFSAR
ncbi:MAG: Dabb family protein [Planctomycetota bacterium]